MSNTETAEATRTANTILARAFVESLSPYIAEGKAAGIAHEDLIPYAAKRAHDFMAELVEQKTERARRLVNLAALKGRAALRA